MGFFKHPFKERAEARETERQRIILVFQNEYKKNLAKMPAGAKNILLEDDEHTTSFTVFRKENALCFIHNPDREILRIQKMSNFQFDSCSPENLFKEFCEISYRNPFGSYREIKIKDILYFAPRWIGFEIWKFSSLPETAKWISFKFYGEEKQTEIYSFDKQAYQGFKRLIPKKEYKSIFMEGRREVRELLFIPTKEALIRLEKLEDQDVFYTVREWRDERNKILDNFTFRLSDKPEKMQSALQELIDGDYISMQEAEHIQDLIDEFFEDNPIQPKKKSVEIDIDPPEQPSSVPLPSDTALSQEPITITLQLVPDVPPDPPEEPGAPSPGKPETVKTSEPESPEEPRSLLPVERMQQLEEMRRLHLITKEEFDAKRKEILDSL